MHEYSLDLFTKDLAFPFFIQYGGHNEDLIMHSHKDFAELVIVLSGEALHLVNQEQFHIKKGDVFVIHKQTSHGYQNVHNFRICNIMYQPEFIDFSKMDIGQTAGFHALFFLEPFYTRISHFKSRLYLNTQELFSISELIKRIVEEYNSDKSGRQSMLQTLFIQLVIRLSRYYETKEKNTNNDNQILALAQSLTYLKQHFRDNILVSELAKNANYSHRHFTRLFKELYHTTPRNYIISLRLEYACELIQYSDKSISDIALESGFDNINYFYRIFKNRTGMSPRRWKEQTMKTTIEPAKIQL